MNSIPYREFVIRDTHGGLFPVRAISRRHAIVMHAIAIARQDPTFTGQSAAYWSVEEVRGRDLTPGAITAQ